MNGTLALVGSGEYLPPIEALDRELLAGIAGKPRVVCLPTAAGTEGAERINYWNRLGVEHFARLGAEVRAVDVIDRAGAQDAALAAEVAGANFVYLSGGRPAYLHETLRDTAVWEAILGVLEAGGVVAGCSAGAMIFGGYYPDFPTPSALHPAFGLLPDTVIIPHFDEIPAFLAGMMRTLVSGQTTLLGIEGNTALLRNNGSYRVAGSGGVTVWNKTRRTRYLAPDPVMWP